MSVATARQLRERRHRRVRGKVAGTAERPRLTVFRSNLGIAAQLIDDQSGRTLAAASVCPVWSSISCAVIPRFDLNTARRGRSAVPATLPRTRRCRRCRASRAVSVATSDPP